MRRRWHPLPVCSLDEVPPQGEICAQTKSEPFSLWGKGVFNQLTSLQTLSRVLITSSAKEGSSRPSIMVCDNTYAAKWQVQRSSRKFDRQVRAIGFCMARFRSLIARQGSPGEQHWLKARQLSPNLSYMNIQLWERIDGPALGRPFLSQQT